MYDGYQRKHESRPEKRKKKEEKEEALKKMKGFILKYINNDDKPNNDTTVTTNVSIPELLPNKTAKQSEIDVINEKPEQIYQSKDKQLQFDDPDPELASSEDFKMRQSNECRVSDPAEWEVNADPIGYYAENIPSQNLETDFLLMGRQFGDKIRYAHKEYFLRKLTNGEVVKRDWLIYSPSTGKVFCYPVFLCDHRQIYN